MDECSSHDNTRAEVLGRGEYPLGYLEAFAPAEEYRKTLKVKGERLAYLKHNQGVFGLGETPRGAHVV